MGHGCGVSSVFTPKRPNWTPRPLHEGLQLSAEPASSAERLVCPQCGASRALYCCSCRLPLAENTPRVQLPFNLWVVTHGQQNESSATGVHLAVLAAAQTRLHSAEELPPLCPETTLLLFPDDSAVDASDVEPTSVTDVVVIDSKWGQAGGVLAHPSLQGVRRVRIGQYRTSYWRFHTRGVPSDGLCTVEAVYFLCRELHSRAHAGACHCFDDLLWLFCAMHRRVMAEAADRGRKRALAPCEDQATEAQG